MAKVCDICQKGRLSGNKVSHSVRKTRRVWLPNIKKVKAVVDGSTKTINVCTKCIKSGKVERAV